jgi:hypothetical protein
MDLGLISNEKAGLPKGKNGRMEIPLEVAVIVLLKCLMAGCDSESVLNFNLN